LVGAAAAVAVALQLGQSGRFATTETAAAAPA